MPRWQSILRKSMPYALLRMMLPALLAGFTLAGVVISPSEAAIGDESLEQRVKAAFLYKFSAYVDWPSKAFNSPASPFLMCVMDSNPVFNSILERMVSKEKVNGRPVVVRQVNVPEEEEGCHILYIGATDEERAAEAAEAARGSNTLTVSENASQGIIGFLIADNRVRFNINDEAAAENGLVISSKLLDLAVNVKRRAKGE